MSKLCHHANNCNLFKGIIHMPEDTLLRYKCFYCLGEEKRWKNCKRFTIIEEVGFCQDFVMPNSLLTKEQILVRMNQKFSLVR